MHKRKGGGWFWRWVIGSLILRIILIFSSLNLSLSSRPEVSTPLTSQRRLAEGYWLKQSSISPYAGLKGNHIIFYADLISAMLVRKTGQSLQMAYKQSSKALDVIIDSKISGPVPLAAFGWVIATHLSLYPVILIIPVVLLLGCGPDAPTRKLFLGKSYSKIADSQLSDSSQSREISQSKAQIAFSLGGVIHFLLWASLWLVGVLALCSVSVKEYGSLWEMFQRTYEFILTVEDLSPNFGVLWYFFSEVFDFFRNFFSDSFHVDILFMISLLAEWLNHWPFFLAFVYIAISSMLKLYPSVGDSALYLDMQFSFFLFCGYVGVSLLSSVMHNLWIWRGTGNTNFYFPTAVAYTFLQIILVVESVSAMLDHDRRLRKLMQAGQKDSKS